MSDTVEAPRLALPAHHVLAIGTPRDPGEASWLDVGVISDDVTFESLEPTCDEPDYRPLPGTTLWDTGVLTLTVDWPSRQFLAECAAALDLLQAQMFRTHAAFETFRVMTGRLRATYSQAAEVARAFRVPAHLVYGCASPEENRRSNKQRARRRRARKARR